MKELIERLLRETGMSQEEFDAKVEEYKQISVTKQDINTLGSMLTLALTNTDNLGTLAQQLMIENAQLKQRVEVLENA